MTPNTYKKIEIVGTSPDSMSAAIRNGLERAAQTVQNLDWFEVTEQRGRIEDGKVAEFQVAILVGFRLS